MKLLKTLTELYSPKQNEQSSMYDQELLRYSVDDLGCFNVSPIERTERGSLVRLCIYMQTI